MSFNGSGVFQVNSSGQPVVANTLIQAAVFNAFTADVATGLSTAILKDGTQTVTANIPFAGFRLLNIGAASLRTDAAQYAQVQNSASQVITTVAGTNTITGVLTPTLTAYTSGQTFRFIPANTNTGATTININSLGAKNIFANGAACAGGEIKQNVPVEIQYDGTQFNIVGTSFVVATQINSGSATSGQVLTANGSGGATFQTIPSATDPTITTLTSGSGSYTPPATCTHFIVEGWGGGGGGGGGDGANRGTGGGGGGYFRKLYASPSGSYSYAVAAAAAAVGQGSGGTAGNATTFDTCTANGGAAGLLANGGAQGGVNGGTATGGDVNIQGGQSFVCGASGTGAGTVSFGGDAPLGGLGGKANISQAGQVPGGGASNNNSTGTGAAGARGEIRIWEFYT